MAGGGMGAEGVSYTDPNAAGANATSGASNGLAGIGSQPQSPMMVSPFVRNSTYDVMASPGQQGAMSGGNPFGTYAAPQSQLTMAPQQPVENKLQNKMLEFSR